MIRQAGVEYSSRVLSEGTLRVLALCTIAVNPWGGSLLALEEPENGVHPRRLELIAQLLFSLAEQRHRQIVVTTHSPLFADAILKLQREASEPGDIGLFNVRLAPQGTVVEPFDVTGSLYQDAEIAQAFASRTDDGMFESLVLRGLIHPVTLGGVEFALELVEAMDLYRAGRNDPSLKAFLDDFRAILRRRGAS